MKTLHKLSKLIAFIVAIFVASCTGEKGDIGPQGDPGIAGQNGTNGVAGAKGVTGDTGATGDQGPTGAQGEKGNTPQLSVAYTDWKAITGFSEIDSTVLSFGYQSRNSIDLVNLVPPNGVIDFSNDDGYLTVKNATTGMPIGLLYRYFRVVEDEENFVFVDKVDLGSINIVTSTLGGSSSNVTVFMWFYFNKNIFREDKSELPEFISSLNPGVRFMFLPISLKARTAAVDMSDYRAVQRAFGLKD